MTAPLRIAVIGLGYVGSVEAAVLAAQGSIVVGVDRREAVVQAMQAGREPIGEPLLRERLRVAQERGTLTATTDLAAAVHATELALVCVGTPRGPEGQLDDRDVLAVCESIARAVLPGAQYTLVLRSTVPPGLWHRAKARIATTLAERGVRAKLCLVLNPEFLREGSAVQDREQPELVVYATDEHERERVEALLRRLWAGHEQRLVNTDPASAEVLKLVANAWHALKVSFANEVARIARPIGVDPFEVMDLLCRDRKLNTSAAYLRPGMPFGGACLVKDVSALGAFARAEGVTVPVLSAVLASNEAHLQQLVQMLVARRVARVAVVGIGFKPGAPDVRDSAPVALVRALLNAGLHVKVADSEVLDAKVPPLGLKALEEALGDPRAEAVESVEAAVQNVELVVVAHPSEADRRSLVALWQQSGTSRCEVVDVGGELSRRLSEPEKETLAPVVLLRGQG